MIQRFAKTSTSIVSQRIFEKRTFLGATPLASSRLSENVECKVSDDRFSRLFLISGLFGGAYLLSYPGLENNTNSMDVERGGKNTSEFKLSFGLMPFISGQAVSCDNIINISQIVQPLPATPVRTASHKINYTRLPSKNYVERKHLSSEIERLLKTTRFCFLKGFGGIGKTELALNYAEDHQKEYNHVLFINCESHVTFESSLRSIFRDLFNEKAPPGHYTADSLVDRLSNPGEIKYLVIIDNIDSPKMVETIQIFLSEDIKAHRIFTGRLDIKAGSSTVKVEKVGPAEGVQMFQRFLQVDQDAFSHFVSFSTDEKEHFIITDLGGYPFWIFLTAQLFRYVYMEKGNSKITLADFSAQFLQTRDPGVVRQFAAMQGPDGYNKSLKDCYESTLKKVIKTLRSDLQKAFAYDFLYFLAFFGTQTDIDNPKGKHLDNLQKVLRDASTQKKVYDDATKKAFSVAYGVVTDALEKFSLIEIVEVRKGERVIIIPQALKWAIQLKSLNEQVEAYKASCENGYLSLRLYPLFGFPTPAKFEEMVFQNLDARHYPWFMACSSYFNLISIDDPLTLKNLKTMLSLMAFIRKFELQDKMQCKFINELSIIKYIQDAYGSDDQKTLKKIKDELLLSSEMDELWEKIHDACQQLIIKRTSAQLGVDNKISTAMNNLGLMFLEHDQERAMEAFELAEKAGNTSALFSLGVLYHRKWLKKQTETAFLQTSKSYFERSKQENPQNASVHYNLGLCYMQLDQPQKALKHFEEAIQRDICNPLYYRSLAEAREKASQLPEEKLKSKKLREVAVGLDCLRTEKELGSIQNDHDYLRKIVNLLKAEDTFHIDRIVLWGQYFGTDHGVLFGKMINYNHTLKSLRLYGCDLDEAALRSIADSLEANKTIETVEIGYNSKIFDAGIEYLAKKINKNRTIKKLILKDNCSITSSSIVSLMKLLPKQLKELDVSGCKKLGDTTELKRLAKEQGVTIIL